MMLRLCATNARTESRVSKLDSSGACSLPRPAVRDGFTFVEILAAMTFLAILVPAVVTAVTIANRSSVIAERSTIATQLAESKLNELIVTNTWQATGNTGDFGTDYPGYSWEMSEESWPGDNNNPMVQLDVTVHYLVQGRERDVQLSTLVNSTLAAGATGTGTGTTGTTSGGTTTGASGGGAKNSSATNGGS